MIKKIQQSFTKFISGMQGLSYSEILTGLKLYSRDTLSCMYGNFGVPSSKLSTTIRTRTSDCRGRSCITFHVSVGILAYDSFRCLTSYPCSYIIKLYVKFIVLRRN